MSSTTPTHGKFGNIWYWRKSGFNGVGLNDLTWGAYTDTSTNRYEVEILATGTPDTIRWREDGGAWDTSDDCSDTTIDSGKQAIAFAATTGHTVGDKWTTGNLYDEPCTDAGSTDAQITSTARRVLNPNASVVFTDDGGETVVSIDYSSGTARFTGNVGVVTCAGDDAYIYLPNLTKVGYGYEWSFDASVDTVDITAFQDAWGDVVAGVARFTGSMGAFCILSEAFFDTVKTGVDATTPELYYLQLFVHDPDDDQTGDYFSCWAILASDNITTSIGDAPKESITFSGSGCPTWVPSA